MREQHQARLDLLSGLLRQQGGSVALADRVIAGIAAARVGFQRLDVLIAHLTDDQGGPLP